MLHVGDEAQGEKNGSQVETQTLRGTNQSQAEKVTLRSAVLL